MSALDRFDYSLIPSRISEGLSRYVEHHLRPGSFLQAVLRNDLAGAMAHGDDESVVALPQIVAWLENKAPGGCWGSREALSRWVGGRS